MYKKIAFIFAFFFSPFPLHSDTGGPQRPTTILQNLEGRLEVRGKMGEKLEIKSRVIAFKYLYPDSDRDPQYPIKGLLFFTVNDAHVSSAFIFDNSTPPSLPAASSTEGQYKQYHFQFDCSFNEVKQKWINFNCDVNIFDNISRTKAPQFNIALFDTFLQ